MLRPLLARASSLGARIPRATFWWSALALGILFVLALPVADRLAPRWGLPLLDLVTLAGLGLLSVRRLADRGRGPATLLVAAIPVLGLLWLLVELGLRKGDEGENPYGPDPRDARDADYLRVATPAPNVVQDVTGLYPVPVFAEVRPTSVPELCEAVTRTSGPLSVGGGRFSMGGQTASPGSLHIDMRSMNKVQVLDLAARTITVQAGIRWCDIQKAVDPHGLSVSIMQTYANFTVGGSLSVNCHGRYVGQGPVIRSVRSLRLVLPDGEVRTASRTENSELFFGAIGGYGGLGILAEVVLELAENTRVELKRELVPVADYAQWFRSKVRDDKDAVFHNGDLYVAGFDTVSAVTWTQTKKAVTTRERLMAPKRAYPLFLYFFWSISETPLGKWRRRFFIDPLFYLGGKVHWRNYEAGYDVGELEPPTRAARTYVLQEYFVPVERFDDFVPKLRDILARHRVNMLNVSIRHALPDPDSLLSWAPRECFAFVCYYKQRTRENARERVAVWTRELIDAVLSCGGTWYLPYQPHASLEQLRAGYPRLDEMFALKGRIDPSFRLRGGFWDHYYAPTLASVTELSAPSSELHAVFTDTVWQDRLYAFLHNVFRLYPEDRFFALLKSAAADTQDEEVVYRRVQEQLPGIKPALGDLTYGLPTLKVQKRVLTEQTLALLPGVTRLDGVLEIGTTGRYVGALKGHLSIEGDIVLVHDVAPSMSPVDMLDREQVAVLGRHLPLSDYAPIPPEAVPEASLDLVTCFVGLHHITPDGVAPFLASLHRVLRPGGRFLLRDHDAGEPAMRDFVSVVHTVFNIGVGEPVAVNQDERRHFASLDRWIERVEAAGFRREGAALYQDGDPTRNALLCFRKESPPRKHSPPGSLASLLLFALLGGLSPALATSPSASGPVLAPPEHQRPADQTFLTFPEWFLVFSPDEFATYTATHPPGDFPFFGHLGQLWSSYGTVIEATRDQPFNLGYHVMIGVIATSTTVEYTLRGSWEALVGRLTEAGGGAPTPEETLGAAVAREYVDFINQSPWYEFDFLGALGRLWTETPLLGPRMLRKLERRYLLTSEYLVKASYGWLIGMGTAASYEAPLLTTAVVLRDLPPVVPADVQLVRLPPPSGAPPDLVLATLPRYEPFGRQAAALARAGVGFVEVAGNRGPILLSVLAERGWSGSAPGEVLAVQPVLSRPEEERVLFVVPVAELAAALNRIGGPARLEHVFDF